MVGDVSCDPEDFVIHRSFDVDDFTESDAVIVDDNGIGSNWQLFLKSATDEYPFTMDITCFNNPPP